MTEELQPADPGLVRVLKLSFTLIVSCLVLQFLLALHPFGIVYTLPLPAIAIAGAAPIILFSRKRVEIIRKIDWPTLVFFISMFVLMAAVFATGVFQAAVPAAATSSVVSPVFNKSLNQPVYLQCPVCCPVYPPVPTGRDVCERDHGSRGWKYARG